MKSEINIYGLIDPREPEHIRYVGKTSGYVHKRMKGHIGEAVDTKIVSKKAKWIRDLIANDILPEVIHLFTTTEEHWEVVERTIIAYYRLEGHQLTNKHPGGRWYKGSATGTSNETPEEKIGRYRKGVETRRRNGTYNKTPESIAKGLQTKRDRGISLGAKPGGVRKPSSIAKARQTAIDSGRIGNNQYTFMTDNEKMNAPINSGMFGCRSLTQDVIDKRAGTLRQRTAEKKLLLPLKVIKNEKISIAAQGPQLVVTCPHCGKSGGNKTMPRWHFDNCKYKQELLRVAA